MTRWHPAAITAYVRTLRLRRRMRRQVADVGEQIRWGCDYISRVYGS